MPTYNVTLARTGYARVRAKSEDEARSFAHRAWFEDEVDWSRDWDVTDVVAVGGTDSAAMRRMTDDLKR